MPATGSTQLRIGSMHIPHLLTIMVLIESRQVL